MCDIVQAYAEKSYDKGKNDGKAEGIVQALLNLVTKGCITLDSAITDSGLNKDDFYSIAKSLDFNI